MKQQRTALFVTCLVDQFFPQVGMATARLLEAAGCRVEFPEAQTCCGQPASNSGHVSDARQLARRWIEIFEPFDLVVTPSGSCASLVRHHYPQLLAEQPSWSSRARELAERTFELTEWLALQGFRPSGRYAKRVAYHPSCHLLRELGVRDAPRQLLEQVDGLQLMTLDDAEVCCGFGGTFSTKLPELSAAMLDDKLAAFEASGADVITATDCGCLMHVGGGLSRRGSELRAVHVAEILAADPE